MKKKITYKDSGVDTIEGAKAVSLMKNHVKKTLNKNVLTELGSFAGLYNITKFKDPVLVSGTDGVGTKLKIAFDLNKHDTIGIDAVAMCVNDVLCHGATPLFFLDYIATGKVKASNIAEIVKGIAKGCVMSGSALIGGETAEMPDFYKTGEYDIAGFSVGIVQKNKIIDGKKIKKGNVIIGLPSSGIHSNGYSLIRKIFDRSDFKKPFNVYCQKYDVKTKIKKTLGEVLLTPTNIYVNDVLPHIDVINGLVHITGGGYYENIPRVMPSGLTAYIKKESLPKMPIFELIKNKTKMDDIEMFKTFNMGIGMMIFADKKNATIIIERIKGATIIGEVIKAKQKIIIDKVK